jgi:1-deoxy-D-xylulose-5-phosphate synthase
VHKLLTGRQNFGGLRQKGGIAGYPQRSESAHDIVESSHASSSLSWADGISRAYALTRQHDRHVVVVIGDGALTGGMTWEALNNITDDNKRNLVIIVNDNGRSYEPTVGGLARFLSSVRTRHSYRNLHHKSRRLFDAFGSPGRSTYQVDLDRFRTMPAAAAMTRTFCPAGIGCRCPPCTLTSSRWRRSTSRPVTL